MKLKLKDLRVNLSWIRDYNEKIIATNPEYFLENKINFK